MSYPIYYPIEGDIVPFFFDTFDGGTGASMTMTGLAVTDIEIYKDGSVTQRSSDAGYALLDTDGIDFDSLTGIHGFSIDLSDNTDAGFFTVGPWYHVIVSSVTVDAQTVNFIAGAFRIVSATRGLAGTALPNAAADAAAGLPVSDAGGLDLDSKLAATHEVTAARMGALTDWINGGRLDLILDIIAADTTTDLPATLATIAGYLDTEIAAILADTNELQTDWADGGRLDLILDARASQTSVDDLPTTAELATSQAAADDATLAAIAALNNLSTAQVNAEVDTAITDAALATAANLATAQAAIDAIDDFLDTEIAAILVDTSTTLDDYVDDLETRLTAALATALQAHALGLGRIVVDAGSTTTEVVLKSVNGAAPSSTDDFYNGRVIIFTSGTLTLQATSISDYVGATATATVVALTGAPAEDVTAILT